MALSAVAPLAEPPPAHNATTLTPTPSSSLPHQTKARLSSVQKSFKYVDQQSIHAQDPPPLPPPSSSLHCQPVENSFRHTDATAFEHMYNDKESYHDLLMSHEHKQKYRNRWKSAFAGMFLSTSPATATEATPTTLELQKQSTTPLSLHAATATRLPQLVGLQHCMDTILPPPRRNKKVHKRSHSMMKFLPTLRRRATPLQLSRPQHPIILPVTTASWIKLSPPLQPRSISPTTVLEYPTPHAPPPCLNMPTTSTITDHTPQQHSPRAASNPRSKTPQRIHRLFQSLLLPTTLNKIYPQRLLWDQFLNHAHLSDTHKSNTYFFPTEYYHSCPVITWERVVCPATNQ